MSLRIAIGIRPALWGLLLERFLHESPAYTVVGRVENEEELAALLHRRPADLVIFDYEALGPASEGAIARLRRQFPQVRILVLSRRTGEEIAVSVLRAGAAGLVSKQGDTDMLMSAIRAVAAGETWAHRRVTATVLEQLAGRSTAHAKGSCRLTRREWQVVDGVCQGLRNRDIAATLGISEKTVKTHLGSVFHKIGVPSRMALALWARDQLHPRS